MMNQMHSNANTELAKDYISKRKIPQLFEVIIEVEFSTIDPLSVSSLQALITGLMVHKPEDHIDFIVESLTKVSEDRFIIDRCSSLSVQRTKPTVEMGCLCWTKRGHE